LFGDNFKAGAEALRIEADALVLDQFSLAVIPPSRVGIAHDFSQRFVEQERLDRPKKWDNQFKTHLGLRE